jgi:hypothetical protein
MAMLGHDLQRSRRVSLSSLVEEAEAEVEHGFSEHDVEAREKLEIGLT